MGKEATPAPAKAKDAPTDKKADPKGDKEKDKDKQKDDKKDGGKDNTKKKGMVCNWGYLQQYNCLLGFPEEGVDSQFILVKGRIIRDEARLFKLLSHEVKLLNCQEWLTNK